MFVFTTLVYPVVLACLCVGAGLLVDRAGGGRLAGALLPAVGAAALIAISQLTTYAAPLAPATPYMLAAVALAGFVLGQGRVRAFVSGVSPALAATPGALAPGATAERSRVHTLARVLRVGGWQLAVMPLAYLLALAPVLAAGRPTFSSYMALADSAVHMLGADYLIHHGQVYSHLDLHNSYGAFVHAYYGSNYPSGADTLFGGSSLLLRLPLIWTFQPFTAFMLATAAGPAWVLVRRVGLARAWAALATLTVTLPALVYAYELIGSVKEIASLPLILSLGALVVTHRRWLHAGARGAIPFALLIAAGVSALGVAFGAWALAATLVLGVVATGELARGALSVRRVLGLLAIGALVLLVAAWPTWIDLAGSLHVVEAIASSANSGNLHTPLRVSQLFGVWLGGSYKLVPTGVALTLTSVLIALVLATAVVGLGNAVRSRWFALAGWFALMIVVWLVLSKFATTWANAKTLMLTSPAVVLMAWAGVAAIRASRLRVVAPLVACLLLGGVFASDALLYHSSNLAPTARYEELSRIDTRFAGRGPTLVTDFDEYTLYELRDMDVGGPDFVYPPPALAPAAGGYGDPLKLNRVSQSALLAYPLILTRRDPSAARPPAAYRLLWEGVYYQVWGRRPRAPAALAHVVVSAPATKLQAQCAQIARVAARARSAGPARAAGAPGARSSTERHIVAPAQTQLVAALAPELVNVPLVRTQRPAGWGLARPGIVMGRAGTLRAGFRLPHGGIWQLWLKGDVMRVVHVAIDGRSLGSLAAQLDGNSLVLNTLTPLHARLSAGLHTLTITRPGVGLAPGDGGAATLAEIFLTPAGPAGQPSLRSAPVSRWRALCGRPVQWVELV